MGESPPNSSSLLAFLGFPALEQIQNLVRQRGIEVTWNLKRTAIQPEFSHWSGRLNRNQPGDSKTAVRDGNFLASGHAVKQLRELRLCLTDTRRLHKFMFGHASALSQLLYPRAFRNWPHSAYHES